MKERIQGRVGLCLTREARACVNTLTLIHRLDILLLRTTTTTTKYTGVSGVLTAADYVKCCSSRTKQVQKRTADDPSLATIISPLVLF